jgi:Fic family protein
MTGVALPEPLQTFDALASELAEALRATDTRVGRYRDAIGSHRVLQNTLEALRVELTYNSNAIEGNRLSLRDTQLVIEGKTPPGEKSLREVYEARNHDRALRRVDAWIAEGRDAPIAESEILELHALVLQDIDTVSAGHYRAERVRIAGTGFIPPGSHRFAELIPVTFERANATGLHPILRAAEFHYNLVAIHPFSDGNGRTARLMMNYLLMRNEYPPALIEVTRRGDYLAAIDDANHGRVGSFASVIVRGVERSLDALLV